MNKIEAELSNEAIARSNENFGAISSQKVEENVEVSQNGTEKVAKVKKSNTGHEVFRSKRKVRGALFQMMKTNFSLRSLFSKTWFDFFCMIQT